MPLKPLQSPHVHRRCSCSGSMGDGAMLLPRSLQDRCLLNKLHPSFCWKLVSSPLPGGGRPPPATKRPKIPEKDPAEQGTPSFWNGPRHVLFPLASASPIFHWPMFFDSSMVCEQNRPGAVPQPMRVLVLVCEIERHSLCCLLYTSPSPRDA